MAVPGLAPGAQPARAGARWRARLNGPAEAYQDAGRAAEAIPLFEQTRPTASG